jgi:hypothetical protein
LTPFGSAFQIIISDAGRRTQEGRSQAEIADEPHPIVANILDELDRWFSLPASPSGEERPRSR